MSNAWKYTSKNKYKKTKIDTAYHGVYFLGKVSYPYGYQKPSKQVIIRTINKAKTIEYESKVSLLAKTNSKIGSLKNYNCKKLIKNYAESLPDKTKEIIKYNDNECKFKMIKNWFEWYIRSDEMNSKQYIGKMVEVKMDRPMGSKHPKHGFIYPVNYGYIPNTVSGDGEELDCYILGVFEPIENFKGKCIAVIHRTNDNDDKLVVVPEEKEYSDDAIRALVEFQERFFENIILR